MEMIALLKYVLTTVVDTERVIIQLIPVNVIQVGVKMIAQKLLALMIVITWGIATKEYVIARMVIQAQIVNI